MEYNYNFIKEIAEEIGEPIKIDGEFYYYKANWNDLKKEQKKQGKEGGDDVRAAGYVLDQLGIPNERVYASDMETDENGKEIEGWIIFWA